MWTFRGHVTAREIEEANEAFYRDGRSDRARYQLIDATDVTSVEWNENDIMRSAGYDFGAERSIRGVKVAYVARDPDIVARLERYVDLSRRLNSSWQFRGFDDVQAAEAWLHA